MEPLTQSVQKLADALGTSPEKLLSAYIQKQWATGFSALICAGAILLTTIISLVFLLKDYSNSPYREGMKAGAGVCLSVCILAVVPLLGFAVYYLLGAEGLAVREILEGIQALGK